MLSEPWRDNSFRRKRHSPGEARPRCLETAGWTLLVSPGSFWNVLSGHMLQMLVREAHAWNGILIIVGMRRILFRTAAEKA